MTFADINPRAPGLTEREATALQALIVKRDIYLSQGRAREAHAVGVALWLAWQVFRDSPEDQTAFDTQRGDL